MLGHGNQGSLVLLVGSVAQIVHFHVQSHGVVGFRKTLHVVHGSEVEIIIWIKGRDLGGRGLFGLIVVHQPARNIVVQRWRQGVKKLLVMTFSNQLSIISASKAPPYRVHTSHHGIVRICLVLHCY